MRTPGATAYADQAQAAAQDALQVLQRTGAIAGTSRGRAEPSPWMDTFLASMTSPRGWRRTCPHLHGRPAPQIIWLAAFKPRVECTTCFARTLKTISGTPEDRRCDACHQVIPTGQVLTIMIALGPLIVTAGHCEPCTPIVRGEAA